MAISIDWGTSIINIPKADLTLVQESPTEIRELDLNLFRLMLKDLEDNEMGITYQKTHNHTPPISVGGVTLARVVEILEPYTVTFENGAYAVNLTGCNSNVADRVNVNNVSVRSANSAGLSTTTAIEYGEYGGAVTVDVENGRAGSGYPIGTQRMPVNNFLDAHLIAEFRGFNEIHVVKDSVIGAGVELAGKIIKGLSHIYTNITIDTGANVQDATFSNCIINGVLDGNNNITDSIIENVNYLNGHIENCSLKGTIVLGGNSDAYIANCSKLDVSTTPIINMGGSGQDLVMVNYSGSIKLTNMTGNNIIGISLNGGAIILDDTITSGTVSVTGIGNLMDIEGNLIPTGTWNSGVTVANNLINQSTVATAVWNKSANSISSGSMGEMVDLLRKITGNNITKSGNILTIYEDDGNTIWRQYDLSDGGRVVV